MKTLKLKNKELVEAIVRVDTIEKSLTIAKLIDKYIEKIIKKRDKKWVYEGTKMFGMDIEILLDKVLKSKEIFYV